MPQIGAAISQAFVWISAGFTGAKILGAVASTAFLTIASRAFMDKSKTGGIGLVTGQQVRFPESDAQQPARVVYGQVVMGGVVVYYEIDENNSDILYAVHAFCEATCLADEVYINGQNAGEILYFTIDGVIEPSPRKSVDTVVVDGVSYTAGQFYAYWNCGDTEQGTRIFYAPNFVVKFSQNWTEKHNLTGIASMGLRFQKYADSENYSQGLPQITARVKNISDILDPRGNVASVDDRNQNPALCLADYLMSSEGLGLIMGDTLDENSVIEASNICDERISLANGGSEPRYTCNGVFSLDASKKEIIEALLTAMAGYLHSDAGVFYMRAGAYRLPTKSLNKDNIIGDISIQTRKSRSQIFNGVKGRFISPDNNFSYTDYPSFKNDDYIAEDGQEIWLANFDLPFTNSKTMAQRLAKIHLERNRRQISVNLTCNTYAINVKIGDTISLTYEPAGWNEKPFYVKEMTISVGRNDALVVSLVLDETSPNIYIWSPTEEQIAQEPIKTSLTTQQILPPSNLRARVFFKAHGTKTSPVVLVEWDASPSASAILYKFQVVFDPYGEIENSDTSNLQFEFPYQGDGHYNIRVSAMDYKGITSYRTRIGIFPYLSLPLFPITISEFKADHQPDSLSVILRWDKISLPESSRLQIRHHLSTYINIKKSILIADVSRETTHFIAPALKGYYFIVVVNNNNHYEASKTALLSYSYRVDHNLLLISDQTKTFEFSENKTLILRSSMHFLLTEYLRHFDSRFNNVDNWDDFDIQGLNDVYLDASAWIEIRTRQLNGDLSGWRKLDIEQCYVSYIEARFVIHGPGTITEAKVEITEV